MSKLKKEIVAKGHFWTAFEEKHTGLEKLEGICKDLFDAIKHTDLMSLEELEESI